MRYIMTTNYPLTVFFDGACGVCSKEMRHYRKVADQRVRFVDISAVDFNAGLYGRSNDDFQRELHVCDVDGNFYTGVEAFRKLWEALPSPFYPLLSLTVGLPGVNLAARTGYSIFARCRHLLPSNKENTCTLPKRG